MASPLTFAERAQGALLGLACGDRFGASLEFVTDGSVRDRVVHLGHWTDDTHMSLYLGEAILAQGLITPRTPFDPARFGTAVGEAFVRWLRDPLTPSTAPWRETLPRREAISDLATRLVALGNDEVAENQDE